MDSLVGVSPKYLLLHGPSKNLVDAFHWHQPDVGIVASYTPTAFDVKDHFGVFRGVDMVESFSLATAGSCSTFLECKKMKCDPPYLHANFTPLFVSIGRVNFVSYLEQGETFISIGHLKFFKYRQVVCDGRIYKVPKGLDLDEFFSDFSAQQLLQYDLPDTFSLVAELFDITGKAVRNDKINK
jgi:hypothetical protein